MTLRFEAWSLPWSTTFERKVADLPVVSGRGTLRFCDFGEASITLPAGYPRLSDVVSATGGSLIRVFDGSTIVHEFLAERVRRDIDEGGGVEVSGAGLESAFDRAVVYPYPYPTVADPNMYDWVWGGPNILPSLGLGDLGNINEEWQLHTVSDPFALTVDGQATSSLSTPTVAQIESALQGLSTVEDVTVQGSGTSDDPWTIIFYNPPDPTSFTVSTGTGTLTKITEGAPDPSPITQSQLADQRIDPALHGTYDDPPVTVVTNNLDTGASWALLVNATGQFAGSQILLTVTPGQTYQVSIRIKTTVTGKYRIAVRDIYENPIGFSSPFEQTVTAGSYTTLSITDLVIPSGVTQVVFRVAVVSSSDSEIGDFYVNWEGAVFQEGLAASTVGEIVAALMDDATTDHAADTRGSILDWVDYSGFSATQDSSSDTWDRDESFTAYRGMKYGQVFDRLVGLGYEWRLTPKASPSDGKTHDLSWFNASNMDAAPSAGITVGQGTSDGPVVSRIPEYNAVLVEGASGVFVEDKDSTAESNFGRFERYYGDQGLASTATLTAAGDALLAAESSNRVAVQVTVEAGPWSRPLVDFVVGDTISFQFPPALSKADRRVRQVSWSHGDVASYQVTGSRVFDGESGAWEAVRKILRRFDKIEDKARPSTPFIGGGGGEMSVSVAASNASDLEKSKADFVCSGTDDHITIMAAFDTLAAAGRIVLSSGDFFISPDELAFDVSNSDDVTIAGMGMFATNLYVSGTSGAAIRLGGTSDGIVQDMNIVATEAGVLDALYGVQLDESGINRIRAVSFFGVPIGVYADSNQVTLMGCRSFGGRYLIQVPNPWRDIQVLGCYSDDFIDMGDAVSVVIADNILGCGIIGTDPRGWIIAHNEWQAASVFNNGLIELGGADTGDASEAGCVVIGNTVGADIGFPFVYADTVADLVVTGNQSFGGGVVLSDCPRAKVGGNIIRNVYEDGIDLTSCDDATVQDNTVEFSGDTTTNTYDLIQVTTTDGALISGNKLIPVGSGGSDKPQYGINIVSGTGNKVVGNDLGATASYGTGAFNDGGTSTVKTYPADATYGDNFTS